MKGRKFDINELCQNYNDDKITPKFKSDTHMWSIIKMNETVLSSNDDKQLVKKIIT